MKTDISKNGDAELSLQVFNNEHLYNLRHDRDALDDAINEHFTYTFCQYGVLLADLAEDLAEMEDE